MRLIYHTIIILIISAGISFGQNYNSQVLLNTSSLGEWKDLLNISGININNTEDVIHQPNNDSDKDRIPDLVEKYLRTDPYDKDTDKDGISDYDEIKGTLGYQTNPIKNDTDDDRLADLREYWWLCDPKNAHSASLTDMDGQLLECKRAPFPSENLDQTTDSDNDGLPDDAEIKEIGTDPKRSSSDGDQFSDGDEYFG